MGGVGEIALGGGIALVGEPAFDGGRALVQERARPLDLGGEQALLGELALAWLGGEPALDGGQGACLLALGVEELSLDGWRAFLAERALDCATFSFQMR